MSEADEVQTDVLPGIPGAIRDLAARRLARSYMGLVAIGVVSLVEWAVSGLASTVALWSLVGAPLSAAALFGIGWKGIRVAAGDRPAPWMTWVMLATVVPYAHGLWVFGVGGLQRIAAAGWALGPSLLAAVYLYLGLRLLRDAVRVAEVGRLGLFMAVPAPEESRSGG